MSLEPEFQAKNRLYQWEGYARKTRELERREQRLFNVEKITFYIFAAVLITLGGLMGHMLYKSTELFFSYRLEKINNQLDAEEEQLEREIEAIHRKQREKNGL